MVSFIVQLCIWINKRGHWPHLLKKCWMYPSGQRTQEAATPGGKCAEGEQALLSSYNCVCTCLWSPTARRQESTRYGRGQKKGLRNFWLFHSLSMLVESGVQDPDAGLLLRQPSHSNTGCRTRSPFCAGENVPVLQSQTKSHTGYWSVFPSSLLPSCPPSSQG